MIVEGGFSVKTVTGIPLKVMFVTPDRLDPSSVTIVPIGPLPGETLLIEEVRTVTVKLPLLTATPPSVVTTIAPVDAPTGTVIVTLVEEFTVKEAGAPPTVTPVVPVKLAPVSSTVVPLPPLVGVKLLMRGAEVVMTKLPLETVVPPGVVTMIPPVEAPAGTIVVMLVAEFTVKVAGVPLKETTVVPVRLVPVSVTVAPTVPAPGV